VTTAGLLVIVVATLAQVAPRPRIPHFAAHTPSVIAHGGAQGHAPGNTLEAFQLALDMGADTLEMDLQLTADREVVVFHDATLDRTTDGSGAIADRTLAQLRELDAGYSFAAADGSTPYRDQGVRIPTFEEVLEAFPDIFLIVEMKPDGGPGIVQAVAERIDARDAQDRTAVASFSLDHLEEFRDALPGVPTNMPEGETTAFYVRHLVGLHRW
jgi:glycerophosphoryl diester phosphodiesterase